MHAIGYKADVPTRAVIAPSIGAVALITGVLAFATWGDGSPEPWIWFSIIAAPLGVVAGIVDWSRTSGKIALAVSLLVGAVWLVLLYQLARSA